MSNIAPKIAFEAALRTYHGERCKWNHSSDVSQLLSACEEGSGISNWILRTALAERTANDLLRDLYDVCSRDLRQNESALPFYDRKSVTTRNGSKEQRCEQRTVRTPLLGLVTKYLDNLYYGTGGTAALTDRNSRLDHFLAYLDKHFDEIEEVYSAECVQSLRQYIDEERAAAKGGAA
jgi:hypothetical protein